MNHLRLIVCMIFLFGLDSPAQVLKAGTFTPGAVWPDDRSIHINAHGGGILEHIGWYYWYGEHKIPGRARNRAYERVHIYSSDNLADRWNPTNAIDERYVWLPSEFQTRDQMERQLENHRLLMFYH